MDRADTESRKPAEFLRQPKLAWVSAKPEPIEIDLHRTALIVVDMQNAFVSKGGMFDLFGWDISRAGEVIAKNRSLIDAARAAGCRVVFLKMSYEPDYSNSGGPESPNWQKEVGLVMMRSHPEHWGRFVTAGTWDEEICEQLQPRRGDVIVRKQRYSGFAGTRLDAILKTFSIKYCIYTGVATNVCVESTLRDGYFMDYWPILVSDAVDHAGPLLNQEATLWNVEHLFGWVATTDDLVKSFQDAQFNQEA